jgi:WD40 repeat protein
VRLMKSLKGHDRFVYSAVFSPSGQHIASASKDRTVYIWNVETGSTVLGPLRGHANEVNSISYSPDGKCIASGSFDKTIRLWDAETGQQAGQL